MIFVSQCPLVMELELLSEMRLAAFDVETNIYENEFIESFHWKKLQIIQAKKSICLHLTVSIGD